MRSTFIEQGEPGSGCVSADSLCEGTRAFGVDKGSGRDRLGLQRRVMSVHDLDLPTVDEMLRHEPEVVISSEQDVDSVEVFQDRGQIAWGKFGEEPELVPQDLHLSAPIVSQLDLSDSSGRQGGELGEKLSALSVGLAKARQKRFELVPDNPVRHVPVGFDESTTGSFESFSLITR